MKTLYFDCFSGAAGDMILGALIDAGVPLEEVRRALGSLAIAPETVWTSAVNRAGVKATKFCVQGEDDVAGPAQDHAGAVHHHHEHVHGQAVPHAHDHGGDDHSPGDTRTPGHPHRHERQALDHAGAHRHAVEDAGAPGVATVAHAHPHRSLADIHALIDGSALGREGRDRAKHLFHRLAVAEAAIHGTPLERVHLHEVGALDSIVDVVGTVFAMDWLAVEHVVSSPLNVGGGTVRSAHGVYPVPAPATLRLLEGVPIYSGRQQTELVTPTGALLVTAYASEYGGIPAMRPERIGYGAGTRDFAETPNVLRVLVGEADRHAPAHTVVVIEAEIDDMNPQIFGVLMDRLLAAGAFDVFYTSIQMKKNRPGTLLTVIAAPGTRQDVTGIIFRETTTIGIRYTEMRRECLDREVVTVDTPLGAVRIKLARRSGELFNAAPEFDDCVRIARERNVPVKDVQAAAIKSFLDQRGP